MNAPTALARRTKTGTIHMQPRLCSRQTSSEGDCYSPLLYADSTAIIIALSEFREPTPTTSATTMRTADGTARLSGLGYRQDGHHRILNSEPKILNANAKEPSANSCGRF